MKNRRLLAVKIANCIYHRGNDICNLGEGKTFIWLLLAQFLQVWTIDIVHEYVSALLLVILKDTINTREGPVVEPFEYIALKNKTISILSRPVFPVGLHHLFECVKIAFDAEVFCKIDGTKTALAQQ